MSEHPPTWSYDSGWGETEFYLLLGEETKGPYPVEGLLRLLEADVADPDSLVGASPTGGAPPVRASFRPLRDLPVYAEYIRRFGGSIVVTTETSFAPGVIGRRLGVLTAEAQLDSGQWEPEASARAREVAIARLRRDAAAGGADAVIALRTDEVEFLGGPRPIIVATITGTAVTIAGEL